MLAQAKIYRGLHEATPGRDPTRSELIDAPNVDVRLTFHDFAETIDDGGWRTTSDASAIADENQRLFWPRAQEVDHLVRCGFASDMRVELEPHHFLL